MLLNLADQSFPTAKVAALMGCTPQAVAKRADKRGWEEEPFKTQGGGKMWRFASMDEEAQHKVSFACIQSYAATVPDAHETEQLEAQIRALWEAFNKKSDKAKERAFYKHSLLLECWRLHLEGTPITHAFALVAQQHGVSEGSLRNWYFGTTAKKGVRGFDPKDWPALLINGYKGRVCRAECDETAWEWLKTDYLRREEPSFSRSFLRMKRIADAHGWKIPSQRTLSRRMDAEVPPLVKQYLRTGSLRHAYPDQERHTNCFFAGQAVNGDALKYDSIYVDFGDGDISNAVTVWFMQDLYSGKILSYETDKTENADMFRLSTYNLLHITLPEHLWIDNTMAAANKALTGKSRHRHRFKVLPDDPVGLLETSGVAVHFTNPNQEMSNPGVKRIERAFQGKSGLHGLLKTHPLLAGCGGSRATAIPIAEFKELLAQVVAEFNATPGRTGFGCNGRSYDEIFAESYAKSKVRKPSKELHKLLLCDQEVATVSHGTVRINAGKGDSKHRYCLNFYNIEHGEKVAVVFNPKNLSEQVEIYDLEGRILGTADWMPVVAYNDKDAAREHARLRTQRNKAVKTAAKLATRMSKLEHQQLNATVPQGEIPEPAFTVTMLSPQEVESRLSGKHKVSADRQRELRANLQKNINALGDEDAYPFAALA